MRGADGKFIKDWRKRDQEFAAWRNRDRKSVSCYKGEHGACNRAKEVCHCTCHN